MRMSEESIVSHRMASNGSKRGQRRAPGAAPASTQHAAAGGRAFSRVLGHSSSAAANFQGYNGAAGDGGYASFSTFVGGGGGGWAPGAAATSFDARAAAVDSVGMMVQSDAYGHMMAYLQIMTPMGPELLCCIYISSFHMSLHQLRSEITAQLPAAHLPQSWNFAKLTVNEGAMFVPFQQEHSMSMSLYISPSAVSVLIVESPPAHSLPQPPPPAALSHAAAPHSIRAPASSYQQQQHHAPPISSAPLHPSSAAAESALLSLGPDSFNAGCESTVASETAADPPPPASPAAIFWNVSALSVPSHTSAAEVVSALRFQLASHLQLSAAVPVYITGCSSGPDADAAASATTALLDHKSTDDAGQRLATELLLWCCHNPRSYVVVACSSGDVLRACRRLALCGHRVILAYSGSSSDVGLVSTIEWNSLSSGLAELPPAPLALYPSPSSPTDDLAIIRSIHSILIDAPVSGLTLSELRAAYSQNRSAPSSAVAPPPLDPSPLGFNNFLELLLCNCDFFVTQWDAASSEYRVRPGAGASRGVVSEDANAPVLSPYEMRTRKRIVHIMQLLRSQSEPVYVVSATMLLQHLRSDGFSEDSLTTDALVRVLRDAIRCGELVGYPPILLNNPDRLFVVLKESALSMLLIVLSSLQSDMLPSTWSGCISRMHEIFPVPQPLRFMPEHLSQFVQLSESGVQIDRNSRGERILLPQGVCAWECIDPNDPSDPYSEQVCNHCTVIVTFLLNTIRTVVKTAPALVLISRQVWAAVDEFLRASPKLRTPVSGRYGVAKALQSSTNPVLKGMPVGRLGHIVSLCVNRGWLRFDGLRAVNTVNSQPRSASGSDWDALVQRICSLICSDQSYDGIILGDLKDRFYAEFGERIDHQRFSFRSLTDLVRVIPNVVVFYDTGRSNNVVCPGPPLKLQDIRCCVLQAALEFGSGGVSQDVLARRLQEMGVDVRGQVFAYNDLTALLASMPGLRCIAPRTYTYDVSSASGMDRHRRSLDHGRGRNGSGSPRGRKDSITSQGSQGSPRNAGSPSLQALSEAVASAVFSGDSDLL